MDTGRRWKLITVRGIPIYVGVSWLPLAAIYIYGQYLWLSTGRPDVSVSEAWALAGLAAVLFFGSILLHEAAHAIVGRAFGLPVLAVTLVFWGGATEVRANMRGPLREFLVAAAGPATTLAAAGAFALGALVTSGVVAELLRSLAGISLFFAALNTVPGFPLDGGRMLFAAICGISGSRRTGIRGTAVVGMVVGVAFLVGSAWLLREADVAFAIFAVYLGAVMLSAGRTLQQRVVFDEQLAAGHVTDAMRPARPVPAAITLLDALDQLRAADGSELPVMSEDGQVLGTVSMTSARRLGGRDPRRPVADATRPLQQTPVVSPDERLDEALGWMAGRDALVMRGEALAGMLGPADIERWYRREVLHEPDDREGPMPLDPAADAVPARPDR